MLPTFITDSEVWGPISGAGVFALFLVLSGLVNLVLRFVIRRWARRVEETLALGLLQTFR